MKNSLVIFFLFCSFGFVWSQLPANSDKTTTDSIPLFLVPTPIPLTVFGIPPFIDTTFIGCIVPLQPPPYLYELPYIVWPTTCVFTLAPTCGKSYHNNGKLSSDIECLNGKNHGYSKYYDEKGRITTVNYYSHGVLLSSKSFDTQGRLTDWANYNGKGELHGYQYTWNENDQSKVISRYQNSLEHGWHEEYYGGIKTMAEKYDQGKVIERKYYHGDGKQIQEHVFMYNDVVIQSSSYFENGVLMSRLQNDSLGHSLLNYTQNERGVLTSRYEYENQHIKGTSLDAYDDLNDRRTTTEYINGFPTQTVEKERGILLRRKSYLPNGQVNTITTFYLNGDTSSHYTYGTISTQKKWNSAGLLTDDYRFQGEQFIGNGHYSYRDTTYFFKGPKNVQTWSIDPIVRYVIKNNDTLRQDYVPNTVTSLINGYSSQIYASNNYLNNLKQGQWRIYDGNHLARVETYQQGILDGLFMNYHIDSIKRLSILVLKGNYSQGLKNGLWTAYNGCKIETTYINNQLEGPFCVYDTLGKRILTGNFKNNQVIDYLSYHPNGAIQTEVTQRDQDAWVRQFSEEGKLYSEGKAHIGTALLPNIPLHCYGKWTFYHEKNGHVSKEKMKLGAPIL